MSTRKGNKGFLFGALAGGVLGSIAALLFAPKAGKELRHDISVQAQKVGDKTGEIAKGIGHGAIELADRTKQAASNMASNVRSFGRGRGTEAAAISGISTEAAEELATGDIHHGADAGEQTAEAVEASREVAAETLESTAEAVEEAAEHGTEWMKEVFAEAGDAVQDRFEAVGETIVEAADAEPYKK